MSNLLHSDVVHLKDVQQPLKIFTVWERNRHRSLHWLVECFAEFLGVFFYVYAGVGSQVVFVLGNILKLDGLSSVFQIGAAYASGIILAIVICGGTSGGHFNPCVTIAFMSFKGFPPLKGLRYILAQIIGAYIACLLIYAQYSDLIHLAEEGLEKAGVLDTIMFTPNGPAGAFGLYVLPGTNLVKAFLNEFITDIMLALVIFGCLDPTNPFTTPSFATVVVALAYAVAIWGYSVPGLAANSARDIGGRLAALTIWGPKAAGGNWAAITALTNILSTMVAFIIHELFLADYARGKWSSIPRVQREFIMLHANHAHNTDGQTRTGMSTSSDTDSQRDKEKTGLREIHNLSV
ncbi:hypothetical protein E1B28_013135 [Marasmius oreades]|uniref:Aquaporin-like protein n=1 Tax=Marasmius oreades TaxID=181124 RepID=A0A9P7UMP1_9AGAR|nr:uncharacterized protein E1B28_013135 [Marasmius oreades]KAG7087155.1 hypothetical protein E1B28_013135 [Marasmius oreades]